MRNWFRRDRNSLFVRLWETFHRPAQPRDRKIGIRKRPLLEFLEDRLAPATLTAAAGVLVITLDIPGETLTISADATAHEYTLASSANGLSVPLLTGATFVGTAATGTLALTTDTSISIVDGTTGTAVNFADSGANSYEDPISVNLTNPLASGVTFNGASTFTSTLDVSTAGGDIDSLAGSAIAVTNSDSLTLQTTGNITLTGSVTVAGETILQANGAISLNNASNSLTGAVSFSTPAADTGDVSFTNNTGIVLGTTTLGTGTFSVTATTGDITQTGPITQAAGAGVATFIVQGATSSITLNNAGNSLTGVVSFTTPATDTGDVSFTNSAGINLGTTTLGTGTFSLTATTGDITQTGPITQAAGAGAATFIVQGTTSATTLNNAGNRLTGPVSFTTSAAGTGAVSFTNSTSIMLGTTSLGTGTFSVTTATGNITQTGAISQEIGAGAVTFSVQGDPASIALNNVGNGLTGTVSFSTPAADSGNVSFTNSIGVNLGTTSLGTGTFSVTATTGDITQTGPIAQAAAAGAVTFIVQAATGAITLNNAGNSLTGTVSFTTPANDTGNVSLTNSIGVILGTTSLGTGTFSVTAATGNISQTGAITQVAGAGAATFSVEGPTGAITLNNAGNNLTGPVSFDTAAAGTGNVSLANSIGVILGTTSLGTGSFSVTAATGNISQTGPITQAAAAGPVTFIVQAATGAITLNNMGNSLTGAVFFTTPAADTGNVSLTNSIGVNLGTTSLGTGTFSVIATTGNITQTGPITQAAAAGAVTFIVQAATGAITLNNAGNDLTGIVSFSTPAADTGNVSLTNSVGVNLGTTSLGTGSFSVTAATGNITQSGPITQAAAAGSVTFIVQATTGAITLNNAGNSLTGAVSFTTRAADTGNVSLTNSIGVILGTTSIGTGTFSVTATTGNISQTGAITQVTGAGAVTFIVQGTTGAITLNNAGNDLSGTVFLSTAASDTGNVSLTNGIGVNLGTTSLGTGTFSVTATTGNITQTGAITQAAGAGAATFGVQGPTGAITLNNAGINLTGPVSFDTAAADTGNVSLTNSIGVILGTTSLGTGTFSVTATTGNITQMGPITQAAGAGAVTFNVQGTTGAITLNNAGNSLTGVVSFTTPAADTGNVSLTNSTGVILGATSLGTGTFSVTATTGNITQTGSITQAAAAGAATFGVQGTTGAITLNNIGNDLTGTVSFITAAADTGNVSFTNSIGVNLGTTSLGTGTFSVTAAAGNITQTGPITQAAAGAVTFIVQATTGAITLNNAGNSLTGAVSFSTPATDIANVSLTNSTGVTLGTTSIGTGTFSVTATTGNISQTGVITQAAGAGAVTFIVQGTTGAIALNNAGNDLTGVVSFSTPAADTGNVSLTNTIGVTLGTTSLGTGSFSVTAATGNITQSGPITQAAAAGSATFSVQATTGAITLNNAGNSLTGAVSFNTPAADTGNVSLTNSIGVILGTTSQGTGTFSVTAAASNITQTGAITQAAGAGAVTFIVQAATGAITLNNAGNGLTGLVSFNTPATDTGNVSFTNSVTVNLGSSSLGTGTFSVTATTGSILEGSILANGTITQAAGAGKATFTLGAGTLVDLATHAVMNFFAGQIAVAGPNVATVAIEDFNSAVTLASLTLPAAPPLQNVNLTFDGPTATITFPASSNFNYNFTLTVTNDIVLPAGSSLAVAGNLMLDSSAGNINLLGTVSVTGAASTTSLSVGGTTSSITANNNSDSFGTSLNLTNPGSGPVIIVSANNLALGMVIISNAMSSLTVTTITGAIAQSAAPTLIVAGNSTFTADNGSVNLNASANTLGGIITASATAATASITIEGSNAGNNLDLGSIAMGSGVLTVTNTGTTAGAGIQQNASTAIATAGGSAVFGVSSNTSAITLNNAGNNLKGSIAFTTPAADTGNVSLTNSTGVTLGTTSLGTGTFSVTAATGNITQTGAITQAAGAGAVTFSVQSTTGAITLTNAGNSLTGSVSLNTPPADTGNVAFTNTGNILLGSCSLGTGSFSVTSATGNIIETGTIEQAPNAHAATFTLTAGTKIDLATSAVQNLFTTAVAPQVVIAGSNITTVAVEDYFPTASLASITLPTSPLQNVTLVFDNPVASVLLPASSNFNYSFSLTTTNDIVLPAGSSLAVTGSLVLDSTAGDLDLIGAITVKGASSTTTLAAGNSKGNITATNKANNYGASLSVTNGGSGTSNITSAGSLALGNVSDTNAASSLKVTAGGAIAQAAGTTLDVLGSSSFTTSTGGITLSMSGNVFGGSISASVSPTGSDAVTIDGSGSTGNLVLGAIALGTGTLSVANTGTAAGDGIQEGTLAGISTAAGSTATLTFTVAAAKADILLFEEPNNLPAGVVVDVVGATAGTTGSIGLRNTSPVAVLSQLVPSKFTTVDNENIEFDATSITLASPITVTGTLSLTAGGAIAQSATAVITAAGGSFSVLNDGGIGLSTATNKISGVLSFANPKGDNNQAVSFTDAGPVALGNSSLGLGAFTVTATGATGTITESTGATITQALGARGVTLTAGGTTIDLSEGSKNDFSGPVTFTGSNNNLAIIGLENSDCLATLPTLTGIASPLNTVTIILDNDPVALPSITAATLNVTAGGNITQQSGTSLSVSGEATFDTGAFAILLGNTNTFNKVNLSNSGENAVTLTTSGALVVDNWTLGSGPVQVTANGAVTETGGTAKGLQQALGSDDAVAGSVTLSAGGNSIVVGNTSNAILGPLVVTTAGSAGAVTIDSSSAVVLGNDSIGGAFTLTANAITQSVGTSVFVVGNVDFTSTLAGITLTNPFNTAAGSGNSIGGSISLNTTSGTAPATLDALGAAKMAASTVQGVLSVTAGGTITQPTGALSAHGASFTSTGGGSITLTNASNDFHSIVPPTGTATVATYNPVSLNTSGSGTISLTDSDTNGLALGTVTFGTGALTLVASNTIIQDPTASVITGSGSVSISAGTSGSPVAVTFSSTNNDITGAGSFALSNAGSVSIDNQGNIALTGSSTISASADVTLVAGGSVTLPNGTAGTLTLDSLSVTANTITVAQNLTTTNTSGLGMSFTGAVSFTSAVTLTIASGSISFDGNVTASKALTVNLAGPGSNLNFSGGTWTQGANNLTINGTSANFDIGDATTTGVFNMSGGTIALTGEQSANGAPSTGNAVYVYPGSTLQVTGSVTLSDGGTFSIVRLNFNPGSIFNAGLGKTPGSLSLSDLNPSDKITIGTGALLSGSGGVASTTAQIVLSISGGGSIAGSFANPSDSSGDFLMGTDIVQATYSANNLSVVSATPADMSSGSQPNGDGYMVTLSGGTGLVVIPVSGGLEIVVRNASVASTLTIATSQNGGAGLTAVDDIVFDGTGATTISAPNTNVSGNITIAGPLTALTLNNWTAGTLTAGGSATNSTTISGNVFGGVTIDLPSKLTMLSVAAIGDLGSTPAPAQITAASFGTINASGNASQFVLGDFNARLVNTTKGVAVSTVKITGALSGNWDLNGGVGSVTANSTSSWNLGLPNGPGVVNGGLLTNVSTLELGTATLVSIDATGIVSTLDAESLNDLSGSTVQGVLQANSFGTIETDGQPATQSPITDHGDLIANITGTGNATGTAIGVLSVAGNLGTKAAESTILVDNGNIGTVMVTGTIEQTTINAVPTATTGSINSLQAARIDQSTIIARTMNTLSVVGNLPSNIFGDFNGSSLTITGPAGTGSSTSLGNFSTARNITNSTITIDSGGVNSIAVGAGASAVGRLTSTTITLESAANGDLGAISAAEWDSSNLTARTITTITVNVRPAAAVSTKALYGNMIDSTIIAFEPVGPKAGPSITTFSVAGALSADNLGTNYLLANNGITSFSVGRNVSDYQVSTDLDGGIGGIPSLSAGEWDSSYLSAFSLGTVQITGFATPGTPAYINGDFSDSDVVIGGSGAPTQAIRSLSVANNLVSSNINGPAGIGTLSLGGQLLGVELNLLNPLSNTSGALTTLSAGNVEQLTLNANTVGTITSTRSMVRGLNGDIDGSTVCVGFTGSGTSSSAVGIGTLSVGGNLSDSMLQVLDGINNFKATQQMSGTTITAAYDAARVGATINSLSVGAWLNSTLTAYSVSGSFSVTGNNNLGLAGTMNGATIMLMGAQSGATLGTFMANSQVVNSNFQVDGNVTSFTSAFFTSSNLFVGYAASNPLDIFSQPASNPNQTSANWEGNFMLGSFTTTATLNTANSTTMQNTEGFFDSDVVASKQGTASLSGLNSNMGTVHTVTFGVGFRTKGGSAGTVKVTSASKTSTTIGSFNYLGLGG